MMFSKKMYLLFFALWMVQIWAFNFISPLLEIYASTTAPQLGFVCYFGIPISVIGMEFLVYRISQISSQRATK